MSDGTKPATPTAADAPPAPTAEGPTTADVEQSILPAEPGSGSDPVVIGSRQGMFGAKVGGDTSGYGGLQTPILFPGAAARPYGSWFDEAADALEARLGGSGPQVGIERVVVDRGELLPRHGRAHRGSRAGPQAPRAGDRPVAQVLVVVDEDPLAALLLPPRRRHEVGHAPLERAGDADDTVPDVEELVGRLNPRVDVDPSVARGLDEGGEPDLRHHLAQPSGRLDDVGEGTGLVAVGVRPADLLEVHEGDAADLSLDPVQAHLERAGFRVERVR